MKAMTIQSVYEQNRRVWNERVQARALHTRTATEQDFEAPLKVVDPRGWLGDSVAGKRALCLASGGGLQSVLLAAAQADVTVVDLSPAMLAQDRRMAAERGLNLRIVETSMDDLSMLASAYFDIVIQPVSSCYIPDIGQLYREVARVTAPGGLYLSQHKQPVNLQASASPGPNGYVLVESYYHTGPLPLITGGYDHREAGAIEFLHRWESLVGGLCRSGFVIEDLQEPNYANALAPSGSFGHRSQVVPPYVAIKARRTPTNLSSKAPLVILAE